MTMKIFSFSLLLALSSFSQNFFITKEELRNKAIKISHELVTNKKLPATIISIPYSTTNIKGKYQFIYGILRKEKDKIDSVSITIDVLNQGDTLSQLSFFEKHFSGGKEGKSYMYTVNKDGIINWAYRLEPITPENKSRIYKNDGSVIYLNSSNPIIDINIDTTNTNTKIPYKEPDEKAVIMYYERLKITLDELINILFIN